MSVEGHVSLGFPPTADNAAPWTAGHKHVELSQLTVKALLIRNIINQQNAHRSSIVSGRNRPEAFLASGIPYLQLHPLAVELYGPDLEVDADCGDEGGGEGVFAEAEEAAGFPDPGVAD